MEEKKKHVIIRHPREKLSKCSLQPLVGRENLRFYTAEHDFKFDATGYIVLAVGAAELTEKDRGKPLLLLDSTWRLLPRLMNRIEGEPVLRSLPGGICTAYPRVSKVFEDPMGGLASVEALYAALRIMGEEDLSLLESYHWRDIFLKNFELWERE